MRILGLSAFYHDSAAALIEDGRIVAAAQEERFSRKKHDPSFPANAIRYCLAEAGVGLPAIDHVAFYDKPFLKFERLLETYLTHAPRGFASFRRALPVWLKEKLFLRRLLERELRHIDSRFDPTSRLLFAEHHQSHAASAFFPSPFEEAVVLTMDGVGEWATTSVSMGRRHTLEIERELHFPHSLGLLYSAFTEYLGFKVNSGEYKVMGLAPHGKPRFVQTILDHLIDVKPDGTFRLDQQFFDYGAGLRMTNQRFAALFEGAARAAHEPLSQRHMDVAASVQAVTEEVVLRLTRDLAASTGAENLCLAGGVALNCVANGKVLRDARFKRLWIQPAAGDAGGALGAALAAYHTHLDRPRVVAAGDGMHGACLGPSFADDEVASRLAAAGARVVRLGSEALVARVADDLASGRVVGWCQGRMEFGPRALGHRSILADPRLPDMQATLNRTVKYREAFRPFAASVLGERARRWFDLEVDSAYMLLVADVSTKPTTIPAVTHVDHSSRVQTVDAATHPMFHRLLSAFEARTGCPVLVNTSFNVRGEPMVCTPEDAFRCFMNCALDVLVFGDAYLSKDAQAPTLADVLRQEFDAD